jgi:hypothetical protein
MFDMGLMPFNNRSDVAALVRVSGRYNLLVKTFQSRIMYLELVMLENS